MELDFSMFALGSLTVLCLGIYAIVYCLRMAVETLWKNAAENKYWRDLALPIVPIAIGLLIGLVAKMYPWPEGFITPSARMLLGGTCGLASGFVYGRFKAWLKSSKSIVPPQQEKDELP